MIPRLYSAELRNQNVVFFKADSAHVSNGHNP